MLVPFRLAQPSNIDWKKVFLSYAQKMYREPNEETVFRTVEDECEEMTRIKCFIASNQNVQMDMTCLESLEKYHIDYISWLGTIKSSFKFGDTLITAVDQPFKARNPITNKEESHYYPEIEIYWMKYNVACINFAKGLVNLQATIQGKTTKFNWYFNKCEKILREIRLTQVEKNTETKRESNLIQTQGNMDWMIFLSCIYSLIHRFFKSKDKEAQIQICLTLLSLIEEFKTSELAASKKKGMIQVIEAVRIWFTYLFAFTKFKNEILDLDQDLANEINNVTEILKQKLVPSINDLNRIDIDKCLPKSKTKLLESLDTYNKRDMYSEDIPEEIEIRENGKCRNFNTFLNCNLYEALEYVSHKFYLRYQREIIDSDAFDKFKLYKNERYTIKSLPYCKFKNTFRRMLSESRKQVESIIKYFQKTLADIKNSKGEDEISDDLKMMDSEINCYYRVFENIYKSKTSIKHIKEECLSFISQLFDAKKEIQNKVNEIEKYNQINKVLNTSGGKEAVRLDFVGNLENIFENLKEAGLKSLEDISNLEATTEIKGYIMILYQCREVFDGNLKQYIKADKSYIGSMFTSMKKQEKEEGKREKELNKLLPLYRESSEILESLKNLQNQAKVDELENDYFNLVINKPTKITIQNFCADKIGSIQVPINLESKTQMLLNKFYSTEKLITEFQEQIRKQFEILSYFIQVITSIRDNQIKGQELINPTEKSETGKMVVYINHYYKQVTKSPLKVSVSYNSASGSSILVNTMSDIRTYLLHNKEEPEEFDDIAENKNYEEEIRRQGSRSKYYKGNDIY